ncbi:phosphatidate cytidylyltransferase [Litorivivens sp.]|uniref:phosphatidate cytidylyltransferase n=1 Tax=Litorivivens sp. TaxID=2020868 RepID=UPI00356B2612
MLKQRIITAIAIVVPLVLLLAVLEPIALMVLFAAIVLGAAWEWSDLSGIGSLVLRALYTLAMAAGMGVLFLESNLSSVVPDSEVIRDVLHIAGVWWAIALLWVMGYPGSARLWGNLAVRALLGFVVLLPTWLALCYLRLQGQGVLLIIYVLLVVIAADVGAYFAGRAWGKSKLAVNVSPNKSWAGFWGGLAASQALALAAAMLWPGGLPVALVPFMVLSGIASLASVLGDLLESMFKRHRGIKDSGNLLPGHGGLLDRLDSLTAAIPVFTLGMMLIGW